jgi:hypothetical protein
VSSQIAQLRDRTGAVRKRTIYGDGRQDTLAVAQVAALTLLPMLSSCTTTVRTAVWLAGTEPSTSACVPGVDVLATTTRTTLHTERMGC